MDVSSWQRRQISAGTPSGDKISQILITANRNPSGPTISTVQRLRAMVEESTGSRTDRRNDTLYSAGAGGLTTQKLTNWGNVVGQWAKLLSKKSVVVSSGVLCNFPPAARDDNLTATMSGEHDENRDERGTVPCCRNQKKSLTRVRLSLRPEILAACCLFAGAGL